MGDHPEPKRARTSGKRSAVPTDVGLGEAGARRPSSAPVAPTVDFGPTHLADPPSARPLAVVPRPTPAPTPEASREVTSGTVDYGSVATAMEALGIDRKSRLPEVRQSVVRDPGPLTEDLGPVLPEVMIEPARPNARMPVPGPAPAPFTPAGPDFTRRRSSEVRDLWPDSGREAIDHDERAEPRSYTWLVVLGVVGLGAVLWWLFSSPG